ncbi:MAG: hypothetical protein Q4D71_06770, partial [Oscillospiraceae bacterium]|nr:hypothetical protein [Oscillospiraceae bacterium]
MYAKKIVALLMSIFLFLSMFGNNMAVFAEEVLPSAVQSEEEELITCSECQETGEMIEDLLEEKNDTTVQETEEVDSVIDIVKTYEEEEREISLFTIIYVDGVDEEVFINQVYEGIEEGAKTPEYIGELKREGYELIGWDPEWQDTVEGDVVYSATWKKDEIAIDTNVNVTVESDPSGHASGSGVFCSGDEIVIAAEKIEGYRFLGWYSENVLVCEEYAYRFIINDADVSFIAKYEKIVKNGWLLEEGVWHYYQNDIMLKNSWIKDSYGWLYLNGEGEITKDRWVGTGGEWYYLKSSGYMACNEWAKDSGG